MTYRKGVKDAPVPRPNKRPRLTGPERGPVLPATSTSKLPPKQSDAKAPSGEEDALTVEFINVMNPRHKNGPAWADGELSRPTIRQAIQGKPSGASTTSQEVERQDATAGDEISDLDWMKSRMADIREGKDFEQSDDEESQENVQVVDGGTKVSCSVPFHFLLQA
jgi:multiple RNA-binding domain-containing protein 1